MSERKPPLHPYVIASQDQQRLLDHLKNRDGYRDYALAFLCLRTGLSTSEVLRLNISDILRKDGVVSILEMDSHIARNRIPRSLPLDEEIREMLQGYMQWKRDNQEPMEPDAPLFITQRTKHRLSTRDFQRVLGSASLEMLGRRLTPYDLRHTFGTTLYQETGNLETVRITLGLTSPKAAQAYVQTEELPYIQEGSKVESSSHNIAEVSIEGTLLMLDGFTPHVAVVVQAVIEGESIVIATALSDELGRYQFLNLEPGQYQVRCYTLSGYVYYQKGRFLEVERGRTLSNIDFRFAHFKKGAWKTITYLDGLADKAVFIIHREPDGMMWFGTASGVSRYDGKEFVNLTTEDGLAGNHVNAIHREPDGILWFGTNDGISRYDGKAFSNLTTKDGLAGDHVNAIHREPDGVLWFGTSTGISRYDGKRFTNLTTKDGLANNNVRDICRHPDGVLWFATAGGVSRYDGKEFVNFTTKDGLVSDSIHVIYCDLDNNLWFGAGLYGGSGGGVSRYDGEEFVGFTKKDGLAGDNVQAIHQDADGVMWFGIWSSSTLGRGVSRYDGKGFINFALKDGLVNGRVYDIYRDDHGALWFATLGGVSRYCEKDFIKLTTKDGLAYDDVRVAYRDPEGILWCGGHGLSRYDGQEIISFTTTVGEVYRDADATIWFSTLGGVSRYDPSELINLITEDGLADGDIGVAYRRPDGILLWYGTRRDGSGYGKPPCTKEGLQDGNSFASFITEDGLLNNGVRDIYRDGHGAMWLATAGGGISRYDGKVFENFIQKSEGEHNHVRALRGAPDGAIWFGTVGGGVYRYDGKSFVNFTTKDGLAHDSVRAIHCAANGVIWFGTGGGVCRYDGKSFVNLTTRDGLVDNNVMAIYPDADDVLWFGTDDGVSRYSDGEFANLTAKDGLAKNRVLAIYRDSDGAMWFGTNGGGVSRYDGIIWQSLDIRDGLAGNTVNSIHQDADGYLWFATDGGMTRYRPSRVPPKVRIVSVTADQIYRDPDAIPAFTVGTRITIEYSAIDLKTVPEKRQYRCRIKEIDEAWPNPTKASTFDYTFEKPGVYTFQMQAIDRDLNYSESAALSLTIQPDPKLVSMQMELNGLRREVSRKYHFKNLIGESAATRQVHALMERAIDSGLTVLITGETGTGKELVARAIHHNSPRKNKPFLGRNCGAIPRELLASELFGHLRGAFTGANEDKMGLFEAASGGTVQLDEIGEMSQDTQIHLLRFLEERKIQRLGENIPRDVDVRIIATTNRDLVKEVTAGRFREDLYYRLSEFPIHIPPLRERPEDIPVLAEHFLKDIDKAVDGFAPGVFEMLQSYSWPGNVRELRNVIRRAAAFVEGGKQIQTYHFPPPIMQGESLVQEIISERAGYSESLDQFRRRLVENALRECNGNRTQAAKLLKMNRPNLVNMIKRLGIDL